MFTNSPMSEITCIPVMSPDKPTLTLIPVRLDDLGIRLAPVTSKAPSDPIPVIFSTTVFETAPPFNANGGYL